MNTEDMPPEEIWVARDPENHKWTAQAHFRGIKYTRIKPEPIEGLDEALNILDPKTNISLGLPTSKEVFQNAFKLALEAARRYKELSQETKCGV